MNERQACWRAGCAAMRGDRAVAAHHLRLRAARAVKELKAVVQADQAAEGSAAEPGLAEAICSRSSIARRN
jgi:ribosomal protein L31E